MNAIEKVRKSLQDKKYQSLKHLVTNTKLAEDAIVSLIDKQEIEDLRWTIPGNTVVYFLAENTPDGPLYNRGDACYAVRGRSIPDVLESNTVIIERLAADGWSATRIYEHLGLKSGSAFADINKGRAPEAKAALERGREAFRLKGEEKAKPDFGKAFEASARVEAMAGTTEAELAAFDAAVTAWSESRDVGTVEAESVDEMSATEEPDVFRAAIYGVAGDGESTETEVAHDPTPETEQPEAEEVVAESGPSTSEEFHYDVGLDGLPNIQKLVRRPSSEEFEVLWRQYRRETDKSMSRDAFECMAILETHYGLIKALVHDGWQQYKIWRAFGFRATAVDSLLYNGRLPTTRLAIDAGKAARQAKGWPIDPEPMTPGVVDEQPDLTPKIDPTPKVSRPYDDIHCNRYDNEYWVCACGQLVSVKGEYPKDSHVTDVVCAKCAAGHSVISFEPTPTTETRRPDAVSRVDGIATAIDFGAVCEQFNYNLGNAIRAIANAKEYADAQDVYEELVDAREYLTREIGRWERAMGGCK